MPKILLIEDDPAVAAIVADALEDQGCTLEVVHDGPEGLNRLRHYLYDLAILDWNLPGMEGIDILRSYRAAGGLMPVLMLTGKDQMPDKETGFTSGADDYLVKPFHIKELVLRTKALLRRPATYESEQLCFENLTLEKQSHKVLVDNESVDVLPKEFQVLQFLMRYPDQVFSQEHLLNKLWPNDSEATTAALRSAVKRLRKKLTGARANCNIKAVYGVGYKLERCDRDAEEVDEP